MTEEQIKQNAFEYSLQNCCVYDDTGANDMDSIRDAHIAGAHSRDEEITRLLAEIEDDNYVISKLREELDKLRNPWISVEERLPKK